MSAGHRIQPKGASALMGLIGLAAICGATLALEASVSGVIQGSVSGCPADGDARFDQARTAARTRLHQLVATRDTPGVSGAVVIDGCIVWSDGLGFANLEHEVPATDTTRFGLGSLSKTLTVAGMLTLVDQGLLDLDAPLEHYVKDFPHQERGITLRLLAAHQSGLSDAFATANNWTTDRRR